MAEYIEREKLMKKFADHVKRSNNSDFAPAPTWNQAVQIVEDSPAADVEERKRGMWQWRTIEEDFHPIGQYECSECGYPDPRTGIFNYCPRCCADMRGKDDV